MLGTSNFFGPSYFETASVSVKLTLKILSIFVAFFENTLSHFVSLIGRVEISGTQPAEMIGALNAFAFSTFPLHLKEIRSVLSDQFSSLFLLPCLIHLVI